MKRIVSVIALLGLLVGCATSGNFQTSAGKFLTTTALSVDTAMKGAALLEVQGVISTNDWGTIKVYYADYQASMSIATNAYNLAVAAGNPALFAAPSNNLFSAQSKLTTKVTTVTPAK